MILSANIRGLTSFMRQLSKQNKKKKVKVRVPIRHYVKVDTTKTKVK